MGTAGAAAIKCFPTIKTGLEAILGGSKGGGTLPVNLPQGISDGYPANGDVNQDAINAGYGSDPYGDMTCYCPYLGQNVKDGGSISAKPRGFSGCASTFSRGALPYRKA